MTWIDLGNPVPRPKADRYDPFVWPIGETEQLPHPEKDIRSDVFQTLDNRRSRREFKPLSTKDLASLLWYCAHVQGTAESEMSFELELRPPPSAGAIHPIHLIIKKAEHPNWWRYDGRKHVLNEVPESGTKLAGLVAQCSEVISDHNALILLLVAEPGKTLAKYGAGCSLVWRDAGVILGFCSVIAEASNLAYCPLGITGEPWASQLTTTSVLTGVGVALLGSK